MRFIFLCLVCSVCMHVYVHMCLYVHVRMLCTCVSTHMHKCISGVQRSIFLCHSPGVDPRVSSYLALGLQACVTFLNCGYRPSCSSSKHFAYWAPSPACDVVFNVSWLGWCRVLWLAWNSLFLCVFILTLWPYAWQRRGLSWPMPYVSGFVSCGWGESILLVF